VTVRSTHYVVNYDRYSSSGSHLYGVTQDCSNTFTGVVNPKWRSQIGQHVGATTDASGSLWRVFPGWMYFAQKRTFLVGPPLPSFSWMWGTFNSLTPSVPSAPTSVTDNLALTRFYSDAAGKLRQCQGMTILGELGKTVSGLKHPFRTLVNLLQAREKRLFKLLKGRPRQNNTTWLNAVSDTWIEIQYGLRPLVHDIQDVLTYTQTRRFQVAAEYYPVKGKASVVTIATGGNTIVFNNQNIVCSHRVKQIASVRYLGQIKMEMLTGSLSRVDFNRLGFGLDQFFPTLWEVTPWSFLIDYFTNVGDLIDSFSVPRQAIAWVNKTVRRSAEDGYEMPLPPATAFSADSKYQTTMFVAQPGYTRRLSFVRSKINGSDLPRPNISFSLPNGKQFVNILALAASKFS